MNLQAVMINSENPEKLVDFYTKVIGPSAFSGGPFTGWSVGERIGLMVGPHSDVKGENKEPGRIMITFESNDVKADFERIKGFGAMAVSEPVNPSGAPETEKEMLLACLADPDGNYLQIASPFDPSDMK